MNSTYGSNTKVNNLFFTVVTPATKPRKVLSLAKRNGIVWMKPRNTLAERQQFIDKLKTEDAALEAAFTATLEKAEAVSTALVKVLDEK